MNEENKKMNSSSKLAVLVIAVIFAVAVIGVAANVIYQKTGFRGTYNKAVDLAIQMDVEEAEQLFLSIEDQHYKDTDAFLVFCDCVKKYEVGNVLYGRTRLPLMKFESLTAEQNAVVEEFKEKLEKKSGAGSGSYSVKPHGYSQPSTEKQTTAAKEPQTTKPSSSKPSSSGKKDFYGANEYAHPDDFYYDHIDDFWDYEEAEDYFYEHTK